MVLDKPEVTGEIACQLPEPTGYSAWKLPATKLKPAG